MTFRRALSITFLFAVGVASAQRGAPVEKPRLVVLCSIDQMAAWVFAAAEPFFAEDGGFRRLMREGTRFADCQYEHACTETGPGHATIGTGVPARVHGIVRNVWYSRPDHKTIYCVDAPMPALPDLPEGKDRGPLRLLVPTLASSVKAHLPGSKVGSVSWKDRAAILMVGGDADLALWFEASTGHLVTNTRWAATTPAWLTKFNDAKAIDGFFGWQWTRSGPADAYAGLVDDRPYELPHANGSRQRTLPQAVDGGGVAPSSAFYTQVYGSPVGNTMVRLAAEATARGMELGKDVVPDLLCVSFSSTDTVGHYFGPDSVEARDTLLRLDHELALFLDFLDEQAGKGKWAMFLTADHGVAPTPEWARSNGVDAGRGPILTHVKSAVETALKDRFGPPPEGKRYVTHVGEGSVFLDEDVMQARGGDLDAVRRDMARVAATAAMKVHGIMSAFATDDLLAPPAVADALQASLVQALCPGRAGDVQLVLKPYWLDGLTPGSHGSPHPYDRQVIAMAIGPGVPAGQRVAQRITPGFGVVLLSAMLDVPTPSPTAEEVPAGFLGRR